MLLCACSLGCSVLGYLHPDFLVSGQAQDRVSDAAFAYNNALRFGNVEMAARWVQVERRASFLQLFADESLRFTDVEIQSVALGPERDEARVFLRVRFYRLPSIEEVALVDEQQWRYDPGDASWYVEPDLELYARAGRG